MKAYKIMLFLMIFNLSVSLVTALNIFPVSTSSSEDYDVSQMETGPESNPLASFGGKILIGMIEGVIMGGVFTSILKIPLASSIVYGIFVGNFWTFTIDTFSIMIRIGQGNIGVMYVVVIFGIIVGIIFLAGFMQIITGGWKAIE